MSKRVSTPYEWPEGLYPLRDWLRARHVDVDALESGRKALLMAKHLCKIRGAMPKHGQPIFPALLKVQEALCAGRRATARPTKHERYVPGTFGPASPVRHIDPAEYLREKGERA